MHLFYFIYSSLQQVIGAHLQESSFSSSRLRLRGSQSPLLVDAGGADMDRGAGGAGNRTRDLAPHGLTAYHLRHQGRYDCIKTECINYQRIFNVNILNINLYRSLILDIPIPIHRPLLALCFSETVVTMKKRHSFSEDRCISPIIAIQRKNFAHG